MAKIGRPKKEIDKVQFEKLCAMQCTEVEICAWFDVTDKTLARFCSKEYGLSFSEVFRIKRQKGLTSLRRTQFQLAEKNPSMAIFLGKNYLGQKDKPEEESSLERFTQNMETLIDRISVATPNRNIEDLE